MKSKRSVAAEREDQLRPRDKLPQRLSNPKWSALNTCTYMQSLPNSAGYIFMCTHTYILIDV